MFSKSQNWRTLKINFKVSIFSKCLVTVPLSDKQKKPQMHDVGVHFTTPTHLHKRISWYLSWASMIYFKKHQKQTFIATYALLKLMGSDSVLYKILTFVNVNRFKTCFNLHRKGRKKIHCQYWLHSIRKCQNKQTQKNHIKL